MSSSWLFLHLIPLAALAAALLALGLLSREPAAGAGPDRSGGKAWIAAGALSLAVLAGGFALDHSLAIDTDDAPITWRYAGNLAAGNGWVYNTGESVSGTSTPLFTILLAAFRKAALPVETTALLLGIGGLVCLPLLLLGAGRAAAGSAAGLLAAAIAMTEGPLAVYATQGMETVFYSALIVGALLAYACGRDRLAWLLAALCVLVRLDGAAVPAAFVLCDFLGRRRPSPGGILLFLLMTLPWAIHAQITFGSVLPESFTAKRTHTRHSEPYWMALSLLRDGAVLFVPLGLLGFARLAASGGRNLVWALWLVFYVGAYTATGLDAYPWYRVPLVPVLALGAGAGASLVTGALLRHWPSRLAVTAAAACLLLAGVSRAGAWRDSLAAYADQLRVWEAPRVATGEWLREHAAPGSVVRTSAIGHIGWISGLRIQDTSGLVSPEALAGGFPDGSADYIVGHDGDPQPGVVFRLEDPRYVLVQSLAVEPTVVYRIYGRRDPAAAMRAP